MVVYLILIPLLAGLSVFLVRSPGFGHSMLVGTAVVHAVLTFAACQQPSTPFWGGWLALDSFGRLTLGITSALFLMISVAAVGYLRQGARAAETQTAEVSGFSDTPDTVFIGCLLLFLAATTLVTVSQHFGLLWIAVEFMTVASAPLICFHRHSRSLEATWKFLMVGSVGIALSLLGTYFLGVAAGQTNQASLPLLLPDLVNQAAALNRRWLEAAFLFLLVGYGTKMGLAPMHTWLPDAQSEAPSVVSALLSGALLNCAFLGILRIHQVCVAGGLAVFSQDLLVLFGLLSMAVAAVSILGQTDFKRLLAYSSVEQVGIMALGIGMGGLGVFGAMLHAMSHAFAKAMLFLLAGDILRVYGTKSIDQVHGLAHRLPVTGVLWLAGFLAISGSPPFGPFISQWMILKSAVDQGSLGVAALYLILLAVIFMAMAATLLGMVQGPGEKDAPGAVSINWWSVAPAAILGSLVLVLGFYIPPSLSGLLHEAAKHLGAL